MNSITHNGRPRDLWRDEKGITTVGMAVAMMLCLALTFSSAQLYQIESASSEIQEVADVAALAAENEVAEFMLAARLCDATILSMTLLSATAFGVGLVCACVPFLEGLSADLIGLAQKTAQARNKFAETAEKGLNNLERLLPFLSAASAARVASANDEGAMNADYFAIAILLPQHQDQVAIDVGDGLSNIEDDVNEHIDDIRDNSKQAEEKAEAASEAKLEAFKHDCGDAPGYCQYERASHLSGLSAADNPMYSSVDAWSFAVALTRAQKYYKARQSEAYPAGSVADKASYHLRMRFYSYVSDELAKGYVREDENGFDCYFPKIFRNTAEFKETPLYTERRYPVSNSGGSGRGIMHAYSGCPAITSIAAHDSISALDLGAYIGCETCGFGVTSMGNIASASTNVQNGFEHHYEKIRAASEEYEKAMDECSAFKKKVEDDVDPIMDMIGDLISEIGGKRIHVTPPGSDGAIALVVNASENAADENFPSRFLTGGTTLGARAAVSGAALVEDDADDNATLITSLLDSLASDSGAAVGAARIVLDLWSGMLKTYEKGVQAASGSVTSVLDSISTNSDSGLGTWASGVLTSVVDAAGLEPADLNALKPAVLNTGHVASASSDTIAVTYTKMKNGALAASSSTTDIFSGLISNAHIEMTQTIDDLEFTIATIEFPVGGISIPIKLALPQSAKDAANGLIDQCMTRLSMIAAHVSGYRAWQ